MDAPPADSQPRGIWPGLWLWFGLCFLAPTLSIWARPDAWYVQLQKPSWNPPSWVFAPVWTTLYTLMAVSAWLVWRRGGFSAQSRALIIFFFQWALNTLWTPIFFGLHNAGLAALEILLLWLVIVATIRAFWKVSRTAALLMVPYLAWVSFASALTLAVWYLNGGESGFFD